MQTLRFNLGSAFTGIAVLTSALLGVIMYFSVQAFVLQGVRDRLADAVGLAALQMDGDLHAQLRKRADESTPAFQELRGHLKTFRDTAMDIRYAYTARRDGSGKIVFVLDAEENPSLVSHLGDVYEEATPLMRQGFLRPYGIRVEEHFHKDQWGTFLSGYAPIFRKNGELEGLLCMDITAEKVIAYERHYLRLAFLTSLGVCALAVALGVTFSRRLSRPLMALEADMSRIQVFDLDGRPEIRSRIAEVVRMKTALENMKSGLRSFRKYVPADLVAELISLRKEATLGVQKRELTIFFSDIANFTSIAERMPPEQLADNLGLYFEAMTTTLLQNRGTVDKFIGDAIMAFWGAPHPVDGHAALACRAALQCRQRAGALSAELVRAKVPPFITRIGIHTGEALVGNIGYKDRLSYTAMGDTVNLASRMESLNRHYGTGILISEATYNLVRNDFLARPVDFVAVIGRSSGVKIYELLAARSEAAKDEVAFVSLCEEGMEHYLGRNWAAARDCFQAALAARPDDRPTQILTERCAAYEKNPPPAGWQGVTAMSTK
ncbi:MAG: adenylate/guanylate cyclase domain-containing protein [Verrucomicrobiota bacterium]|nr:adenylate/guanylate cyclase domain-containing protein [Verrucomicrobiota bacterium]